MQRRQVSEFEVALDAEPDGGTVSYLAAAPARRALSFSGSGLPHPGPEQAFSSTPNAGVARDVSGRSVRLLLEYPGAYHAGPGGPLVPPAVHLAYSSGGKAISQLAVLGAPLPGRSLVADPGAVAQHLGSPLPTQEQRLRHLSYGPDKFTAGRAS
jgi:hypothetical protein